MHAVHKRKQNKKKKKTQRETTREKQQKKEKRIKAYLEYSPLFLIALNKILISNLLKGMTTDKKWRGP